MIDTDTSILLATKQFTSNVLIENTYNDIYLYMGASDEEPEVPPKTGINVNNVFQ